MFSLQPTTIPLPPPFLLSKKKEEKKRFEYDNEQEIKNHNFLYGEGGFIDFVV